jgi:hypothetical protein
MLELKERISRKERTKTYQVVGKLYMLGDAKKNFKK